MAKKQRHLQESKRPAAPPSESLLSRSLAWMDRRAILLSVALVIVATVRIVATYDVFNHTIDEPAHIACGMEWLDKGVYRFEDQHPPLARVASALGPYLDGARSQSRPLIYNEGAAILYYRNLYDRTLALARLGILPFFWLASAVVFLWTGRLSGNLAAVLGVFLFTSLPPVLAQAGLATTDMAVAATLPAAFLALILWLERPDWRRTILLAVCLGLMLLSKFSALAFFPTGALILAMMKLRQARPGLRQAAGYVLPAVAAVVIVVLVAWAGYRFSFGKVHFADLSLPAPELYRGIKTVADHNEAGHPGYLLGEYSEHGWWVYYFVALAVKSPLPFLGLLAAGFFRGRRLEPAALVAGILAVAVFSRINIGIRHVLPVYVALSVLAAGGAAWLLQNIRARPWCAGLLALQLGVSALAHPDYLPYFNLLAGSTPEKILVDSDLDWGQDMKRLAKRLQEVGAREVYFDPFIVAHLELVHGFPPIQPLDPLAPKPGWNAVSLTVLKLARLGLKREHPEIAPWPERIPAPERVGKSILLYYFPPGDPRLSP